MSIFWINEWCILVTLNKNELYLYQLEILFPSANTCPVSDLHCVSHSWTSQLITWFTYFTGLFFSESSHIQLVLPQALVLSLCSGETGGFPHLQSTLYRCGLPHNHDYLAKNKPYSWDFKRHISINSLQNNNKPNVINTFYKGKKPIFQNKKQFSENIKHCFTFLQMLLMPRLREDGPFLLSASAFICCHSGNL
jgi:hypothetical protein